jgi:hypothetical protein
MHAPATPTASAMTVHTMLSRGVWALPVYAVLLGHGSRVDHRHPSAWHGV